MISLSDRKYFEVLGLGPNADEQAVRLAYRQKVKACHPDQYQDAAQQKAAQELLIQLNLAYEEALKVVSRHRVGFNLISQEEAKHFALRLIDQGNLASALRQLGRADSRDDGWYYLQGQIFMGLRQYEDAHKSFREAVRLEPDNRRYREGALDAALAMKKNQQLGFRVQNWLKGALGKK
ncbi:MAG: DnaJ domain-containing protein [Candidatus Limiplasma sp.]|nr:DnaJ domain-containing protein [Candidatus Limiplasma sp.]